MLEHDATLIRQPTLIGQQQIEGLCFFFERFDERQRARLILARWQPGASVYRFADVDVLRFVHPQSVHCATLRGWPLIRQGRALCSAELTAQELQEHPAADVLLVRGGQLSALQFRDARLLAPGEWIDVSAYTLLDTYDCRSVLPEPVHQAPLIQTDMREILGGALEPVSPEREAVMQALLARRHQASSVDKPGVKANFSWPWLKLGVSALLVAAIFWMGTHDAGHIAATPSVNSAPAHASSSFDISGWNVGAFVGALIFGLFAILRGMVQHRTSIPGKAASTANPTPPALAPRATPVTRKPAVWRRWLTHLSQKSRLSALYGKRQAVYMQRMLAMFEDGDLQEALRHAIPLGSGKSTEQAFGTPERRQDLAIKGNAGPGRSMLFEQDMEAHLKQLYRRTFERLDRENRIEEAVFVLAELLKARQEALDYLEKHGRYQQAADIALAWDFSAPVIVRLLCVADNWQRAVQVARRDNAFADAVMMLQAKWPENADRLRLEWAESLTDKGLWLQAVDVLWPLPDERKRAAQWLLNAEAAGGRLAIDALVKRAVLLPDTLAEYGPWVEQLRDDPRRYSERAILAERLLSHKSHTAQLIWLCRATVYAILVDHASGHGRLSPHQLQSLVKMSKDKLLQADLPTKAFSRVPTQPLRVAEPLLEWSAPPAGSRTVHDAVPLCDSRYLLALGEAGALVIDATGQPLFHFPVPAQSIVLAHGRQVALVLACRDEVWRVSKLDLVNRSSTDLGVHRLDLFARSFDGSMWTVARGDQLRVVDTDRGFETVWHVSDLPGRIVALRDHAQGEYLWLSDVAKGDELWHYRLPDRRLVRRDPLPNRVQENSVQLFGPVGEVSECWIKPGVETDPILVLANGISRRGYRLPGFVDGALVDTLQLEMSEDWLVIGYLEADLGSQWRFIHRDSDRCCASLRWPATDVRVRCVGADWLMFDRHGRLSHINVEEGSQRGLSVG